MSFLKARENPVVSRILVLLPVLFAGCGLSSAQVEIVDGQPAAAEVAASTVSMAITYTLPGDEKVVRHMCTGAILNSNWIVTAGHCLMPWPMDGSRASLLAIPGTSVGSGAGFRIVEARRHKEFASNLDLLEAVRKGTPGNDVALLRVAEPFSAHLRPVLIGGSEPLAGALEVAGYGSTVGLRESDNPLDPSFTDRIPKSMGTLFQTTVKFLRTDAVRHTLVVSTSGAGTPCEGDSGGPLFSRRDGRLVLHGLVEGGFETRCHGRDDVDLEFRQEIHFTSVAHYRDMILNPDSPVWKKHSLYK